MAMTKQILVVEDELDLRVMVSLLLEQDGHSVLQAKDGYAALALLEEATPDLFILDLMMPGMDGVELCRRIRSQSELAHTPIIVLSAVVDTEQGRHVLKAGANDYLAKPFSPHELSAKVRQLLMVG